VINKKNASVLFLGCWVLGTGPLAAAMVSFKPLLQLRWRQEVLNTLSANRTLDHEYSYGAFRERFGGDVRYDKWVLHVLGQGSQAYHLPNNASFGAGQTYFNNSRRDTSPTQLDVAELSIGVKPTELLTLTVGRQAIKDGGEPASGNARLDWLRDQRIAERLIGPWEWPHVARRFDGATFNYTPARWSTSGFAASILQGGFDYPAAFKPLDDVKTAGLAFTAKEGLFLPKTEIRFFNIGYRDDRAVTRTSLRDELFINTIGLNLMGVYPAGPGSFDALVWLAYQFGDYGNKTQSAQSVIVEGGYGLPEKPWAPWLRGGIAYASGGSPTSSTHRTFVNMAPTNHKFYGMQDLNALQNLTDIFGQLMVQPVKPVKAALEAHLFRLSSASDAWYGGSGPISDSAFGIAGRTAAGGLTKNIGSEIDLTVTTAMTKQLSFQVGASHFEGGSAAKRVFPVKSCANFLYIQTMFQY
jgi:hypothetical protein